MRKPVSSQRAQRGKQKAQKIFDVEALLRIYIGAFVFFFALFVLDSFPNRRLVMAQSPQSSTARQQKAQSNPSTAEAIAAFERGDVDMARRLFEEALSADPKNTTALTFLGFIADRSDKLAEAAKYFEKAVKFDPDQASARNLFMKITSGAQKKP